MPITGKNTDDNIDDDFPDQLISWQDEANAIINDVKNHVKYIEISNKLESTSTNIFLNLETLEKTKMCIRISGDGFQVVGHDYDCLDLNLSNQIYETPYALLSDVSKSYIASFGGELSAALQKLM